MRTIPRTPRRVLSLLPAVLAAGCCVAPASDVRAELRCGAWRELFPGIEHATGETDAPRLQQVHAVRIDLQPPDLRLVLTPDNGDAPRETTSQTASQFLAEHGLQVAVNVHFYGPCCAPTPEGKDLVGLAVADGQVVSQLRQVRQRSRCVRVALPASPVSSSCLIR